MQTWLDFVATQLIDGELVLFWSLGLKLITGLSYCKYEVLKA